MPNSHTKWWRFMQGILIGNFSEILYLTHIHYNQTIVSSVSSDWEAHILIGWVIRGLLEKWDTSTHKNYICYFWSGMSLYLKERLLDVVKLNFLLAFLLSDCGPAHFVVFTYGLCTIIAQCCATIWSTESLHHCPLHGMILTCHIESPSFWAKPYIHVLNVGYTII
jgi:hypothetical protein